eukprot:2523664-Pyramimonas_sp.AAC.1
MRTLSTSMSFCVPQQCQARDGASSGQWRKQGTVTVTTSPELRATDAPCAPRAPCVPHGPAAP